METKEEEQTDKSSKEDFKPSIYLVCLTGGPCAGKTSAMNYLKEKLTPKYVVFFAPELASLTVLAGVKIKPSLFTKDEHIYLTKSIIEMQMNMEDFYLQMAALQKKDVIVITDRGCVDNLAYCTPEVRAKSMETGGWNYEDIRDKRYDGVVHLVTAADGAPQHYTLANNKARSESPEVAIKLDKLIQSLWNGHPSFILVSNHPGQNFQEKMDKTFESICKIVNDPVTPTAVRKYLLRSVFQPDLLPEGVFSETYVEKIDFLTTEDPEKYQHWVKTRHLKTKTYEAYSYFKRVTEPKTGEKIQYRKNIDSRHYDDYLRHVDPDKHTIYKEVVHFIYNNQTYAVETFQQEKSKNLTSILVSHGDGELPDFISIYQEITGSKRFKTASIARNKSLDDSKDSNEESSEDPSKSSQSQSQSTRDDKSSL